MKTKKLSLMSLSTERFSSGKLPSKIALSKECWEGDCFMDWWRRLAAREGEDSSERWTCSLRTHTNRVVQQQRVKACGAQYGLHTHKHGQVAKSPALTLAVN